MTRSRIDSDLWPEMAHFAKAVTAARRARGLTQAEVSRLTGLDTSYLSAVENLQANPSAQVIITLARTMDLPVAALWPTDEIKPTKKTPA